MQEPLIDQFHALDKLRTEALEKIREFIESTGRHEEYDQLFEVRRTKLVRDTNVLISKYKERITVLKVILQDSDLEESKSRLGLYEDRINDLRQKLRRCQVQAYDLEDELVHEERLAKYEKEQAESKVPDSSLNVDKQRDQLFSGRSGLATKNDGKPDVQSQIHEHNKSITSSLQSTKVLMSASIIQTELNIDSIQQQSKQLVALNDKFSDFESLMNKSKNIVKFIEKQDRRDKTRIYWSFLFLALCCLRVLWRRILKVPVKLFLWFVIRTFRLSSWAFFISFGKDEASFTETLITTALLEATATSQLWSQSSPTMETSVTQVQRLVDEF
ncbi:Piso0_000818 [Millerozyma farinosa CBS 7064]|uniref:Piso0_000818 protein n=1 Tax=Pichia sorbitophila (strain ATCC MYA-4447 / BCRC 22081 / CBS 7064 / NBRC 10061 / NRRL Y-12695) TaxID=559304 RepID=G8YQ54_PICSO|nr:Piso0_000818 [Millerozyma farinosa CBS 7064]